MKRALALSGGGAKGAYQLGVLEGLLEQEPELEYEIITGISVGALNTSQLSQGKFKDMLQKLHHVWFDVVKGNGSIWTHHVLKYLIISVSGTLALTIATFLTFMLLAPQWVTVLLALAAIGSLGFIYYVINHTESIYDNAPLKRILKKNIDLDALKNSGIEMRVGAVNYKTGEYESADQNDPDIRAWVAASSSFPVFFPLEKIRGQWYTDGGVRDVIPVADAIKLGATHIDVIATTPLAGTTTDKIDPIIGQIMRNIEIQSKEIQEDDLEMYRNTDVKFRIWMPEKKLTENSLNFSPKSISYMYQQGLESAKNGPTLVWNYEEY
jgi:NTE family protein